MSKSPYVQGVLTDLRLQGVWDLYRKSAIRSALAGVGREALADLAAEGSPFEPKRLVHIQRNPLPIDIWVSEGWIVPWLDQRSRKPKFALSQRVMDETFRLRQVFVEMLVEASSNLDISLDEFSKEYAGRRRYDEQIFKFKFAEIAGLTAKYRGFFLNNFADLDNGKGVYQRALMNKGFASVQEFCGCSYLSATGSLLAARVLAMRAAAREFAEREKSESHLKAVRKEVRRAKEVANPRLRFWLDRLPSEIALQQFHWERHRMAFQMRERGIPLQERAKLLGVSSASAAAWAQKAATAMSRTNSASPAEAYLNRAVVDKGPFAQRLNGVIFTFSDK